MNSRKTPSWIWMVIVLILAVGGIFFLTLTANKQTVDNLTLPLQVTEYFDYDCSHCIEFHDAFVSTMEKYGDQVQVNYSYFPFLGQESYDLAYAAEAAKQQNKFIEFHEAVFAAQKNRTAATLDIDGIAKTITGLDIDKFDFDRQSSIIQNQVLAIKAEGSKVGVSSTPTIFIQGKNLSDYTFSDGFKPGIGNVGADGKTDYTIFDQTIQRMIDVAKK